MPDKVISVENLGKQYCISHKANGEPYVALRDVIARQAIAPLRAIRKWIREAGGPNGSSSDVVDQHASKNSVELFWGLRNVSFDVKQGEVLGIIGRNGAGKSTLLKILSRITEPTEGRVCLRGRVASLLEVGTGFHPELTGRENIYLNGGILGMSRTETKAKFDEIVAFAEVEKFLDTPVKRYSSGMYVRLAFAVAAHLEPEILIVDEVLAVGDAEFQKKCLGKMHDVAGEEGRTVLFVSHNLDSILRLCGRVLWLNSGSVRDIGPPAAIIHAYSGQRSSADRTISLLERHRPGWVRQKATVQDITCLNENEAVWSYAFASTLDFVSTIAVTSPISTLSFAYAIFSSSGFEIASARAQLAPSSTRFERGRYNIRVCIPNLRLTPDSYSLNLGLSSESGEEDFVTEAAVFEVITNGKSAAQFADSIRAACIPESRFLLETIDSETALTTTFSNV
jgi:lipopolysaccharide transport system ATP-binding protein